MDCGRGKGQFADHGFTVVLHLKSGFCQQHVDESFRVRDGVLLWAVCCPGGCGPEGAKQVFEGLVGEVKGFIWLPDEGT